MKTLLHAELIKLRTTRTFAALAGLAIFTSLVFAVLVTVLSEPTADNVVSEVFTADTSQLFILMLAIIGISGEWRHRTIAGALLAVPDRMRFLAAKTIAFGAAGVVLSLLISLAVVIVAFTILTVRDLTLPHAGELLSQIARNAGVAALLGAFGVGLGALMRNQLVAIVLALALTLMIEPTVMGLAPDVGRFGPLGGLPPAIQGIPPEDIGLEGVDLVSAWPATLAMFAWIGVLFAAGAALLSRRDLQ